MKFRISTLLGLALLMFTALFWRAFDLQIISAKKLNNLARKQHTQTLMLQPDRGIILDRSGEKLAATIMTDSVCADPSKVKNPIETAGRLAAILNVDKKVLVKRLSTEKNFCWIGRKIAPEQANLVSNLKMEGIFTVKEPMRYYPAGELAGHLVGFVGMDAKGLDGLELQYENYLRGVPQKLLWNRDAKGKRLYPQMAANETIDNYRNSDAHNYSLVLTIDKRIQHLVESHLKKAVLDKGAKGGYAIVMDPRTGEIVALANEMAFDPNNFKTIAPESRQNRAIADAWDPGSTFKPFMAAAALNERVAQPTDMFYCEDGHYAVANRTIHEANRKRHGMLSLHDIIKYSSNIGSAKVAEKLGKEKFYEYIKKFGFGDKTGIDLPGEAKGLLRPVERWTRVDTATIAFGQGISVTGIQLITALSSIANDGILMKPFIVRAMLGKNGEIVQNFHPTQVRRVISSETAKTMTAILTDVVGMEDGTGKNARIANISVAGKTGTAQKFDFKAGAYSSQRVRTSFMGFFPAEAPQIAMLIVLDEPQKDRWGGVAAAPVFKNIGEQLLTAFKTNIRRNPEPEEINPLDNNIGLKFVSAPATLANVAETAAEEGIMPNFSGMTIREALRKSRERGLDIRVVGSGWAAEQTPAAGMPLPENSICTVTFKAGS
ncbi:MAG: penicillin-binding transpeptidase domain-containing protein [Syntrophales bacterium]|nr:penicillin-binding transpeptidase domain-containing protein [Syntrophales bacterium]